MINHDYRLRRICDAHRPARLKSFCCCYQARWVYYGRICLMKKILTFKAQSLVALLAVLLSVSVTLGQAPSTGTPTAINTAFVKLFGTVGPFTAKVDTQVLDPYQKETVRLLMDFTTFEGKVRLEISLAQMQSQDLPPSKIAELKQSGMERIISLFRPDKKVTYIVYPGIQSYLSMPVAKEDIDAFE